MTVRQLAPVATPGGDQIGAGPAGDSSGRGRGRHRWIAALFVAALVFLGAVAVVLLTPPGNANGYLDPASTASDGARAITDLLAGRGQRVVGVYNPEAALSAAQRPDTTLVITSPYLLAKSDLASLESSPADIVLVEPTQPSLDALRAGINLAPPQGAPAAFPPDCQLPAAVKAGPALTGGTAFQLVQPPASMAECYFFGNYPSVLSYESGGRAIAILGDGTLLSNNQLASQGDAALALNLLAARHNVVWLIPQSAPPPGGLPPGGGSSGPQLIPLAAQLVVWQLVIAALLAAAWRIRRLGALVSERLPVVVRASETVEGHARLYQSRHARDRAAAQLRQAMLGRIMLPLGLPRGAPQQAIIQAIAARSHRSEGLLSHLLFGPPPGSDSELVELIAMLDELEREVRAQ